jgi:type II secretory pathway pseudopilin PulG
MKDGFTLVEVLVTALILTFIIAGIFAVLNVADISWHTDMGLVGLQQQARQAMDGMIRELRQSKASVITINSSSDISFSIPAQTYGDPWLGPIRYYLDSGIGQIKREYVGATKILANDITALSFSITGDVVEIQLAAKLAARGRDLCFPVSYCNDTSKTLKEKVKLRNE